MLKVEKSVIKIRFVLKCLFLLPATTNHGCTEVYWVGVLRKVGKFSLPGFEPSNLLVNSPVQINPTGSSTTGDKWEAFPTSISTIDI